MSMYLTWHGHSCYTVKADDFSIVLDPYAPGSVPGLPELSLTADLVLSSHGHRDHGDQTRVTLLERGAENPFTITAVDTFHDDKEGTLRGTNRIHILEADGVKIAHLGDLGCPLTDSQMELLSGLDALLIPVGGYYTIDATQAKELVTALKPRVTVPMHYRTEAFGYAEIGTLDEYTKLCDDVKVYDGNALEISKDMAPQTAVLTYM